MRHLPGCPGICCPAAAGFVPGPAHTHKNNIQKVWSSQVSVIMLHRRAFAGHKDKKTSCNLSLLVMRALFFGSLSKCLWQQCKEDAVLFYTQPLKLDTRLPSSMTHKQLWCTGAFNQWRVGDNTPSVFICIMTTGTACPCPACWLDGEVCGGQVCPWPACSDWLADCVGGACPSMLLVTVAPEFICWWSCKHSNSYYRRCAAILFKWNMLAVTYLHWDVVVHTSRQSDWGGIVGKRSDHM